MTKKELKIYERMIGDVADGLMIDAYRVSLGMVDDIHREVLLALRRRIDKYFEDHPDK
jgi:hypothetical protein